MRNQLRRHTDPRPMPTDGMSQQDVAEFIAERQRDMRAELHAEIEAQRLATEELNA